jgi:pimeloyl-ACP methyl ester carboxylesterase
MSGHQDTDRRRFLGAAVALLAGHAGATHANASSRTRRHTSAATDHATGTSGALGTPKQVAAGVLDVGYTDAGPAGGRVVILLHGWPYDVHSFVEVVPLLVAAGYRVIVPHLRGFGPTRFLSGDTARNGQQAALAHDVVALMDALAIDTAVVAGFDWGARTANIVAALWPKRCRGLVAVSGYLIANREANQAPLTPQAEYAWWYQYYFATERGERGYREHTRDFARLIWRLASPAWRFDEPTFDRSARSFDNPDHVRIVIHNYRWRLGVDAGEPRYDAHEAALAKAPPISIPAITLQGDADGAPHPDSRAYAAKFTGWYRHRTVAGGVGHNLPQEAPRAFAEAVIDVARVTETNRGVEP